MRKQGEALANWAGVIGLVMTLEFGRRFKGNPFATILALLEPLLVIGGILLMRGVFRGQLPQYGTSLAVFYSSGILPFYLFARLMMRVRATPYDSMRRLPRVSSTDVIIASSLTEGGMILAIMLVWFTVLSLCGLDEAVPYSFAPCFEALSLLACFGIGVGLINSAIARRFPIWHFIYQRLTFELMFLSGIFYIVDLLPYFLRSVIVWNPIVHGIEWFRLGLYGHYPTYTLDRQYLEICALVALFLGLVGHASTLRVARQ